MYTLYPPSTNSHSAYNDNLFTSLCISHVTIDSMLSAVHSVFFGIRKQFLHEIFTKANVV